MSARQAGLAATAAVAAGYAGVQHLGRTWGATREERRRRLPGDDLVANPKTQTTPRGDHRGSTGRYLALAGPDGVGSRGVVTYRWVDLLLFPASGPSATRILPAHQRLAVGDHIPDGPPETACHFTVRELEPPSVLVLHSDSHLFGRLADREDVAMDWAWTWHLTADALGGTRVVQRNNLRLTPRWLHLAYVATIVPADFVMAPQPPARSHASGQHASARTGPAQHPAA